MHWCTGEAASEGTAAAADSSTHRDHKETEMAGNRSRRYRRDAMNHVGPCRGISELMSQEL